MKKALCIATAGKGGQDELRVYRLTNMIRDVEFSYHFIDKKNSKISEMKKVFSVVNSNDWDLVYQEGTGIASGFALILASYTKKQRYIVSSGDPIAGFFRTTKGRLLGNLLGIYETLLYERSAGFVGWTPYLTGVSIYLGAKKAVTVEGGVDTKIFRSYSCDKKRDIRSKYGLDPNHLVVGIVGSLIWVPPQSYCYGYELTETLKQVKRDDVSILVVGDGDGKERLERSLPAHLKKRAVFTGRIPEFEVVDAMNAMDIGFVTLFGEMGNYRLTTKLPEYLACGTPIAMNPTAAFYDYAAEAGWPLPDNHPSDPAFHRQCAEWLDQLSKEEIDTKAQKTALVVNKFFDYSVIGPKFEKFVHTLLRNGESDFSNERETL
ncbi:MAG: glycosyltransferase [Cyanobacteria bacterium J06581_3]